jgi:hypothetical protein
VKPNERIGYDAEKRSRMKSIIAVLVLMIMVACDTPTNSTGGSGNVDVDTNYRYAYEFKNDRSKEVVLHYSREFDIIRSTQDSKGKGYYVDSLLSTFDSVVVPIDSIVTIGSNNDTLLMSPAYLLAKVPSRLRAIEYGHGMRWLSNDEY